MVPVARFALLVVMMTFFAVLALDISVPAVVLSLMALSNTAVLPRANALKPGARREQAA